jgi:hypothetical protein
MSGARCKSGEKSRIPVVRLTTLILCKNYLSPVIISLDRSDPQGFYIEVQQGDRIESAKKVNAHLCKQRFGLCPIKLGSK